MKKKYLILIILALVIFPAVIFAQTNGVGGPSLSWFYQILVTVIRIVNSLTGIVIGLGVVVFLWGLVQYVASKDPAKKTEAVKVIISGVVVLFVMVSVWGLVNFIGQTLRLEPYYRGTTTDLVQQSTVVEPANINDLSMVAFLMRAILSAVVPLLIITGVMLFLWGISRYIIAKDDATKENARNTIVYGIITLFVMVSVWGLVNVIANTFSINIYDGGSLELDEHSTKDISDYFLNK